MHVEYTIALLLAPSAQQPLSILGVTMFPSVACGPGGTIHPCAPPRMAEEEEEGSVT